MALPLPDLAIPPLHSAVATQIGEITASSAEPPIISAALFPWANASTTFYCTVSPSCAFSSTTFETWVVHELNSHPGAHSLWYCHLEATFPSTIEDLNVEDPTVEDPQDCNLTFASQAAFETHYVIHHCPIDAETGARDFALVDADFFLGPKGLLGDNYGLLYWCGFCKKVLKCNMMGDWKIDRFEHVAAHFHPMHARFAHFEMKEWKYLPSCRDEVQQPLKEKWMWSKAGLKAGKSPVKAIASVKDEKLRVKDEKLRAMIRKRLEKAMRKEQKKVAADAAGENMGVEDQEGVDDADDEAEEDEDEEGEEEWEEWENEEEDEEGLCASNWFSDFGVTFPDELRGSALAQEGMTDEKGKGKERAADAAEKSMGLGMPATMDQEEPADMEREQFADRALLEAPLRK